MSMDPSGAPSPWNNETPADQPAPDAPAQPGPEAQFPGSPAPYPVPPYGTAPYGPWGAQPPYPGQVAYPGQAAYPADQPPYPTDQPPYVAPQAAYPLPPYPGQPWGQPASTSEYPAYGAYPAAPLPEQPAKPAASPILGIVGLAGVVILGIIMSVLYFRLGATMGGLVASGQYVPNTSDPYDTSGFYAMPPDVMANLMSMMTPIGIVGFLGLACWVVSIVAVATKRGRPWGVAGIIVGVVAPIIAAFIAVAGMMATMGL